MVYESFVQQLFTNPCLLPHSLPQSPAWDYISLPYWAWPCAQVGPMEWRQKRWHLSAEARSSEVWSSGTSDFCPESYMPWKLPFLQPEPQNQMYGAYLDSTCHLKRSSPASLQEQWARKPWVRKSWLWRHAAEIWHFIANLIHLATVDHKNYRIIAVNLCQHFSDKFTSESHGRLGEHRFSGPPLENLSQFVWFGVQEFAFVPSFLVLQVQGPTFRTTVVKHC